MVKRSKGSSPVEHEEAAAPAAAAADTSDAAATERVFRAELKRHLIYLFQHDAEVAAALPEHLARLRDLRPEALREDARRRWAS